MFPRGTYLTGPFNLTSNTRVIIEHGARILESGDHSLYPPGRNAFVNGYGVSNIEIIGGGVIDGQGCSSSFFLE